MAMKQDYKQRKEAFVSNLVGGDIQEINEVTLVASVSVFHELKVEAPYAIGTDDSCCLDSQHCSSGQSCNRAPRSSHHTAFFPWLWIFSLM